MTMLIPILLGLGGGLIAVSQAGGAGGASGGGAGGGGGSPSAPGSGSPPGAPHAPPGQWPKPGDAWRPRQDLPYVIAQAFPGRVAIQNLQESPGDAPPERDREILSWLDAGQLDAPLWHRIPVRGGLEVEVMGDVLSFGGVRLCGSMIAAQGVADGWDAMIMTPGICNAVWSATTYRLKPRTMDPNPGGAKEFMLYIADRYQEQLVSVVQKMAQQNPVLPRFICDVLGKDYVLDARLNSQPTQCAIYGLHTGKDGSDQTVIQSGNTGASLIHHLAFFDYSQAIRLVRRRCWLNGAPADLAAIYAGSPDLVNLRPGMLPPPTRHPAIPFRASSAPAVGA